MQAEAKIRFERGVEAFARGKYELAAKDFRASYQLRPVPIALFNLAESYTALDRFDDAMTELDMYLASVVPEALDPAQRDHVLELQQRIRKAAGTVRITEAPEASSVTLDGKERSQSLMRPVYLAAGIHRVAVAHPDYAPWQRTVQLVAGDALVLAVKLMARPREALVRVVVSPRDASLRVDGKPSLGARNPLKIQAGRPEGEALWLSLPAGWHELSWGRPGRGTIATVMELKAGETRSVSTTLGASDRSSLWASPWFWAGVGLVAGGTVGFVAAHGLR